MCAWRLDIFLKVFNVFCYCKYGCRQYAANMWAINGEFNISMQKNYEIFALKIVDLFSFFTQKNCKKKKFYFYSFILFFFFSFVVFFFFLSKALMCNNIILI